MRPWIKSYTHLISNSTYMNLTAGSRCLWHDCNLWVGLNDTDGVIPAVEVDRLKGTPSKINGLLKAGFWEETETDNGKPAYRIMAGVEGGEVL